MAKKKTAAAETSGEARLVIESDGTSDGTSIKLDGKKLPGVVDIRWSLVGGQTPVAMLTIKGPEVKVISVGGLRESVR